jgi:PKD repeat protein
LTVSFTNSSVGSESYLWNFGDGETSTQVNPIHEYASAGIYNVTLIAGKCNLADTLLQAIELTITGMEQVAAGTNLTWELSPNPASNSIILKLKGNRILNYKIVNCLGKEMQYGILRTSEEQISVATFPTGLYILQILDNESSCGLKKFLVTQW